MLDSIKNSFISNICPHRNRICRAVITGGAAIAAYQLIKLTDEVSTERKTTQSCPSGWEETHIGDPGSSKVFYMKQLHAVPGMSEDTLLSVGRSQFDILKALNQLEVNHIFVESVFEDSISDGKDSMSEIVRNSIFPDGIPENPNNLQLELLAKKDAAYTYFWMHDGIHTYKTLSKEKSDYIDSQISSGNNVGDNILSVREELTLEEMKSFFNKNKGKDIVLIYGAGHKFHKYFNSSKDFNITLCEQDFSKRNTEDLFNRYEPQVTNLDLHYGAALRGDEIDQINKLFESDEDVDCDKTTTLKLLNEKIELYPKNVAARNKRASILVEQQQYSEAAKDYKFVLGEYPLNYEAKFGLEKIKDKIT